MPGEPIKIDGLSQFVRGLGNLDSNMPKMLRVALNGAADIVVDYARPRVPRRTGRAARSIKAASTRSAVRIAEGSARAPHMPWLDFGGRVGRNKSVVRRFIRMGRFLYPALEAKDAQFTAALNSALMDAVRAAGIEVD